MFLFRPLTSPIYLLLLPVLLACQGGQLPPPHSAPEAVYVAREGGQFHLYRRGEPFFVRGACTVGTTHLPALAAAGANTLRTYPGDDLDAILPLADSLGLAVIVGLDMPPARYGVDYRDPGQRARIRAHIRTQVLRYQGAPAVLMWAIGNEVQLLAKHQTAAIYAFVDSLSQMIHQLDSLHPTTYMVNGPDVAWDLYRACPDLDIISINTFSSLPRLDKVFRYAGWAIDKPVLISEWAPKGYWNAPVTAWSAPLEMDNVQKAQAYVHDYLHYLQPGQHSHLLGSCLFLWGQKQEQTHTWFSLFTEAGEMTGVADAMQEAWTGHLPLNRAPLITAIRVDPFAAGADVYLHAGATYTAEVAVTDPEGDSLRLSWEVTAEFERGALTGGDAERRPPALPGLIGVQGGTHLLFRAPDRPGPYRLYAYARDGRGKAGAFNIPFYVLESPHWEGGD